MAKKNTINLYCCGGTGINIGESFASYKDSESVKGWGLIRAIFVDTSTANVRKFPNIQNFYHIKTANGTVELDGSGKIRKENANEILESVPDILHTYRPADLNIIVSSASGGSGSVIAPGLATELLDRGENVVVICVGTSKSGTEIKNTIKTLESYDGIARLRKVPVAMIYAENEVGASLQAVNDRMRSAITALQVLFSGEHHGLDSADLRNWLYFTKVVDTAPRVALLEIFTEIDIDTINGRVMSVATLACEDQSTDPGVLVEYHTEGIVSDNPGLQMQLTTPTHYALIVDSINSVHKRLQDLRDSISETHSAQRHRSANITSGNVDDRQGGLSF